MLENTIKKKNPVVSQKKSAPDTIVAIMPDYKLLASVTAVPREREGAKDIKKKGGKGRRAREKGRKWRNKEWMRKGGKKRRQRRGKHEETAGRNREL